MSFETLEKLYNALSYEPETPNEIAAKIDLNQKTVQGALLELVNTTQNIKWKQIWRYKKSDDPLLTVCATHRKKSSPRFQN